jgi:hypothetical protein|nr:MAG TPA: hypothetical protein [Caudoviricetes sp.]
MRVAYNIYDANSVNDATRAYNNVANNAPTFAESTPTKQARAQADNYANSYKNRIDSGYKSSYSDTLSDLADKYMNNEFKFNANDSSEYQQYNDKYKREGATQQENVQGSYSANTGGYTNSYAQAAGQKEYNNFMDELQNKIPTLKNNAYQNWSSQQEDTLNKISTLQGFDNAQYQRYRDKVQDDYDFMTYYENKYSTSKGLDMSNFQNELARWQAQMSAATSNLSNIRNLAEQQYEHNNVSADTQASIDSSKRQNDAYYNYLNSKLQNDWENNIWEKI